jgi:hypothetical protein
MAQLIFNFTDYEGERPEGEGTTIRISREFNEAKQSPLELQFRTFINFLTAQGIPEEHIWEYMVEYLEEVEEMYGE